MIEVTWDNLTEQLRALAAERPGYVYQPPAGSGLACFYVEAGVPGCIYGHALKRLGIPLGMMSPYEGQTILTLLDDLADRELITVNLTSEQRDKLDDVQNDQDGRKPWDVAVERLS